MRAQKLGKAAENKRIKREALLASALDLFTSKGLSDTTIAEIAENANVAKGTFYLYFKDKYDLHDRLVCACARNLLIQALSHCDLDSDLPVEEKIMQVVDSIVDGLAANRTAVSFIKNNLSWGLVVKEAEELDAGGISFADAIRRTFANSTVQYKEPILMVYFILQMISAICYDSIIQQKPRPIKEIKEFILADVRGIVRAHQID